MKKTIIALVACILMLSGINVFAQQFANTHGVLTPNEYWKHSSSWSYQNEFLPWLNSGQGVSCNTGNLDFLDAEIALIGAKVGCSDRLSMYNWFENYSTNDKQLVEGQLCLCSISTSQYTAISNNVGIVMYAGNNGTIFYQNNFRALTGDDYYYANQNGGQILIGIVLIKGVRYIVWLGPCWNGCFKYFDLNRPQQQTVAQNINININVNVNVNAQQRVVYVPTVPTGPYSYDFNQMCQNWPEARMYRYERSYGGCNNVLVFSGGHGGGHGNVYHGNHQGGHHNQVQPYNPPIIHDNGNYGPNGVQGPAYQYDAAQYSSNRNSGRGKR